MASKRSRTASSIGTQTERQLRSLLKSIQRAAVAKPGPAILLKLLAHQERLEKELKRVTAERIRQRIAELNLHAQENASTSQSEQAE